MKKLKTKLKNLNILVLVLLFRLIKRRANKIDIGKFKTVIIFHDGKLGDMVCATPVFRAIKEKYPNVKVVVFGDSTNKEVINGSKDVDEYVVLDKKNVFRNVVNARNYNADYGITLTPGFLNLAPLLLSGISFVATPKVENGWSPYETIPYKIVRKFAVQIPHRMGEYAPGEYLKMLEPINIFTKNTKKHLNYSKEAEEIVKKLFHKDLNVVDENRLLICISPSSGNKVKNWYADRFADLANKISNETKSIIVIIGGKNDRSEVNVMKEKLSSDVKYIDFCGLISIDELKALISQMDAFISVDTGPVYVAEAFDVPTIDIVGPMDEREQPPISNVNMVVVPKERIAPELHIMNARTYNHVEARRQVDSITVDQVFDVWMKLLTKIHPGKKGFLRDRV